MLSQVGSRARRSITDTEEKIRFLRLDVQNAERLHSEVRAARLSPFSQETQTNWHECSSQNGFCILEWIFS